MKEINFISYTVKIKQFRIFQKCKLFYFDIEWHEKGKLTVNGTPKKPRILKRDKDSEEPPQPQV